MLGVEPINRPTVRARLAAALTSPPGKRTFARARMSVEDGSYVVTPVGGSGSHLIASLAQANALVVVPEATTSLEAGGGGAGVALGGTPGRARSAPPARAGETERAVLGE